jgi:hypothetical protein
VSDNNEENPNKRVRLAKGSTAFGYPVASLRTEQRKGNLAVFRVAGKDYVSEAAIREMENKCLHNALARDSRPLPTTYKSGPDENDITYAAAMMSAKRLRESGRKKRL